MAYTDKLNYIYNEIICLTGIETEIICDDRYSVRFITDKRSSRSINVNSITSMNDLVLYARLASLDLTKPVYNYSRC